MLSPTHNSGQRQRRVLPIVADKVTVKGSEGQTLLDAIELSLGGRGATVLIGPNGAGKSLTLRVLAGLVPPSSGSLTWAGQQSLGQGVKQIGFVFQKPILFRRSVQDNVAFALRQSGYTAQQAKEHAFEVLKEADLVHLADAPARRLSGGEQQRVAIARARAIQPEVLFLDEPTAHLDPTSTAIIEQMIRKAKSDGICILHVTHDMGQAKRLADDVLFLHHGQLVETTNADTFFEQPTSKVAQAFVAGGLLI